jgi:hypothetical protein
VIAIPFIGLSAYFLWLHDIGSIEAESFRGRGGWAAYPFIISAACLIVGIYLGIRGKRLTSGKKDDGRFRRWR